MTTELPSIPLADLRASFDLLLRRLETTTVDGEVALDKDYFWSVPAAARYDVTAEPGELTIGQVSESWAHIKNLLADQDRAVGHHLVWLADVLRAIGHEFPG
ncbi:hypothetical protein [Kitasatospora viridis]|nr:hypothetical protein [Kitasatospora viridis]